MLFTILTYGGSGRDWELRLGVEMPPRALALRKTAKALCRALWNEASADRKVACEAWFCVSLFQRLK